MNAVISSRHGSNPDHNIWNNHGTWWVHFTVHHPDNTKQRIRASLHTKDREEARRRRDVLMQGTVAIAAKLPHRHLKALPDVCKSPEPAGHDHEGIAAFRQQRLAHEEAAPRDEAIRIRVRRLLAGQLDVAGDRASAHVLRAAVGRFHDSGDRRRS